MTQFTIEFDSDRIDEVRALCNENLLVITEEESMADSGTGPGQPVANFKAGKDL